MSIEAQLHGARNQQEALSIIARALDRIETKLNELTPQQDDAWSAWSSEPATLATKLDQLREMEPPAPPEELPAQFDVVMNIPKVSEERQAQRLMFAQQTLKLDEYFGNVDEHNTVPEGYESWAEIYAKGGPVWLYNAAEATGRDCIMSYPHEIRKSMIEDVMLDNGPLAAEMARDILKYSEMPSGGPVGVEPDEIRGL